MKEIPEKFSEVETEVAAWSTTNPGKYPILSPTPDTVQKLGKSLEAKVTLKLSLDSVRLGDVGHQGLLSPTPQCTCFWAPLLLFDPT